MLLLDQYGYVYMLFEVITCECYTSGCGFVNWTIELLWHWTEFGSWKVWGGTIDWFEVLVVSVVWGWSLGLILTAIVWIARFMKCWIESSRNVPAKRYECAICELLSSWIVKWCYVIDLWTLEIFRKRPLKVCFHIFNVSKCWLGAC